MGDHFKKVEARFIPRRKKLGSFCNPCLAWRSSTCRHGCFAVLIWRPEQSRLGGELPLVDPARLVDEKPIDQHVVLIRDKAVIQRAFLCRFVAALGRAFFCYQLLTTLVFSVIGKWRARQELTLLPSPNPSHGGIPWLRLIPFLPQFPGRSQARPGKRPQDARHWSELITGGLPIGTYVATAFFATVVILVGCAPWNFLLILGLLLNKDEVLRWWISSKWGSS